MEFKSPQEYLSWEYSRISAKKRKQLKISLDDYMNKVESLYIDKQLYENDKVLFNKLEAMASNLDFPIDEQDRNMFPILNRHSQNVTKILNENNYFIPQKIVLGTLPINDVNAGVGIFPNGQLLIALNEGLIRFIYSMGRVISSFFTKKSENTIESTMVFDMNEVTIRTNLKENAKGHSRFIEALVLYFLYRDLSLSNIYFEKDLNLNLSGILWDTAEFFAVAHEYSHVLLGHLSKSKDFVKRYLDKDSVLFEALRNWEKEFSADKLALQITLAYNQSTGRGSFSTFLGIEFLFVCLHIIDKVTHVEFSETHPSAEKRIAKLRKGLKEFLPDQCDTIINGSKIIHEIGSELLNINQHYINNIYDNFMH